MKVIILNNYIYISDKNISINCAKSLSLVTI